MIRVVGAPRIGLKKRCAEAATRMSAILPVTGRSGRRRGSPPNSVFVPLNDLADRLQKSRSIVYTF